MLTHRSAIGLTMTPFADKTSAGTFRENAANTIRVSSGYKNKSTIRSSVMNELMPKQDLYSAMSPRQLAKVAQNDFVADRNNYIDRNF